LFTALTSTFSFAQQTITWESLRPQQTQYQTISPSDKALIAEIYVYSTAKQSRTLSPMELRGYQQRLELAESRGLNVDELLTQRAAGQQQANSVIADLNVDDMKLAGYLVPLEMSGLVGTQFILVPTAGACIHTPPPPMNQTILVDFPEGYELQSLYTAVWVKGDIKAGTVDMSVALSDGNQTVQSGYVVSADEIEVYQ
jgi:hypothetical protein